ncbi:MAG: isocitrate/isopropylmalate family dehydrogenase, partial [Woeseiaceae bacterium]|nr:isocitrate/isopropylmalate family dehydrogenase [Woeseiaceae bacterium]
MPGDGVGPEVTAAARQVLEAVADRRGHRFDFREQVIGGAAIDACDDPLPAATIEACTACDAVLLGAVGGPKWSDPNAAVRPEQGLLRLRSVLGVYANLRPVRVIDALIPASPLKAAVLHGVDLLVVRELTGGIYFGDKTRDATSATDVCRYTVDEVERIVRMAAARGGPPGRQQFFGGQAHQEGHWAGMRGTTNRKIGRQFKELRK